MDLIKKYLVLENNVVPRSYSGDQITGLGKVKDYELDKNEPLLKRWPKAGAVFKVKDGDPKHPVLADSLLNIERQLIISERLKKALEALKVTDVEYLPLKIKAKDTTFPVRYYVIRFLNWPDVLDAKASGAQMGIIAKTEIDQLKRLVFKKEPSHVLFRPAHYDQVFIIRWDAAETLAKQGFSGIEFRPLFEHPEFSTAQKNPAIQKQVDELNEKLSNVKVISLEPIAKAKPRKRIKPPLKDLKQWEKVLAGKKLVVQGGDVFEPIIGEDIWLDVFNFSPDNWPAFDPKRYYCIGTNNNGDYYLLDLEDNGSVVYFTHEQGYNDEDNFEKVAKNLLAFKKMVKEKK